MHPSVDVLAGRGQPEADGTTSVLAPRGILSRSDNPFRTPPAVQSRVRMNMRTYVVDALKGGDWRKRAQRRIPKAVAEAQRQEDWPILYSTRGEVAEYMELRENVHANERWGQPKVTLPAAQDVHDYHGLDVVDCGENYSPVRGTLPESIKVTEEWLQLEGTGVAITRTNSVYGSGMDNDLSHDVYDDFIDSLANMMALGITSVEDGVSADMSAPVHATIEEEVAEEDVVGLLGPFNEKGTVVGVTDVKVAKSHLTRQKSSKGNTREPSFGSSMSLPSTYGVLNGF